MLNEGLHGGTKSRVENTKIDSLQTCVALKDIQIRNTDRKSDSAEIRKAANEMVDEL